MSDTKIYAADELKKLREAAGFTIRRLAERLDMPHTTYASMEDRAKNKREELRVEIVEKLVPILVGRGTPAIEEWEVWERLARRAPPERQPHRVFTNLRTAGEIVHELERVDSLSIRCIREFLTTLPECPERLRRLEETAVSLREEFRGRMFEDA